MKKPLNAHILFDNQNFLKLLLFTFWIFKAIRKNWDRSWRLNVVTVSVFSEKENIINEACTIFEVISKQNKCKFFWLPNKMWAFRGLFITKSNFKQELSNFFFLTKIILILMLFFSSEPNLLVRACNQLGQFLSHRETNLRYLALESMCLLATSEFSHDAVKKHQETVINALKTERLSH